MKLVALKVKANKKVFSAFVGTYLTQVGTASIPQAQQTFPFPRFLAQKTSLMII